MPAVGELGNSERNGFTGPSQWNFNMSLQKGTQAHASRVQLEVRLEAFNVFNHRNYGNPGLRVDAGRRHVRGESGLGHAERDRRPD